MNNISKYLYVSIILILAALNSLMAQKRDWVCLNLNMATENDVYYGVENRYKIIVEGLNCKEYRLRCDSCILIQDGCKVSIEILDPTIDLFKLKLEYGSIVDTINFFVGKIPTPSVYIAAWVKNPPNRYHLDYLKISIPLFQTISVVESFKLDFIRNDQVIYSSFNKGAAFTEEDRRASLQLKLGDVVRLKEVVLIVNDRLHFTIEEINFPIE